MGNVVDLGRAPDDHSGSVADLYELPAFAAFCRGAADADRSCGAEHLRRTGHSHRVFLDAFPESNSYAASRACVRRWTRLGPQGPAHDGRLALEYPGMA